MSLSSDLPRTDPKDDLFGHAPFAEQLAKSIAKHAGEAGLVLSLDGPWGSGKSTVLGYVRHFLREQESGGDLVIADFNPWWFAGRDDLAHAFLRQLQAVLPGQSEKLKEVGTLLGDFAEGIGGLIDLTGLTGGGAGLGGKLLGLLVKRKPKDVPAVKAKIATGLRKAGVRVLVLVDDIDRLDNAEVRQLFTVIKALADFPYVTYLLAFDHEVAAKAIQAESHLPGDRYLEKIIQVPFHLPAVDRVALRSAFAKRLDEILAGTPVDDEHWTDVFFDGVDSFIRVPRDIVRLTNALSVTYPAVKGEVNPVDFIAIEAIRIFAPGLYDTLRAHPGKFAGHSPERRDMKAEEAFHDKWIQAVPEAWRPNTRALVERLFPKTGTMGYAADWLNEWRRDLRVCHPDLFPVYFRLSLPSGAVSRAEITALVASLAEPSDFKERLLAATKQLRPDGISKSRELLERLMDHVPKDVPDARVPVAISALLDIGDDLVEPREKRGIFEFGSDVRVARPVYHLLKRVPKPERRDVMERAIRESRGLHISSKLLWNLDRELAKHVAGAEPPLVEAEELKALKTAWAQRARVLISEPSITGHTEFRRILESWYEWGDATELRAVCAALIASDVGLLQFLHAFLHEIKVATSHRVNRIPRLNPEWLRPFVDIDAVATRLNDLLARGEVPEPLKTDVAQFLKERDMLASGQDPDKVDWNDD